jgi:hypothetical protein
MSLTKLSLGGNNDVIYKLFPPRESLVSDIPAGNGNIEKLFYGIGTVGQAIGSVQYMLFRVLRLSLFSFYRVCLNYILKAK